MLLSPLTYKNHSKLVRAVINYILWSNPDHSNNDAIVAHAMISENINNDIRPFITSAGAFTSAQCLLYLEDRDKSMYDTIVFNEILTGLERAGIIQVWSAFLENLIGTKDVYYVLSPYGKKIGKRGPDLIVNKVIGFAEIRKQYKDFVLKIENVGVDDTHSIGTGFLVIAGWEYGQAKSVLITNKHVLDDSKYIRVLSEDNTEVGVSEIVFDSQYDIAFLFLNNIDVKGPYLIINPECEVLDNIITIGYPSVPLTKDAYQLTHKGEINSIVEDYFSGKLLIISNKTSAGNSGSPVINDEGCIVAIGFDQAILHLQFLPRGFR